MARQNKVTRRVRVSIKWLEPFGIQRGDTAIIAMTGDVQVGELGYFSIYHSQQNYNQFAFVCEPDSTCFDGYFDRPKEVDSVCLRERGIEKCHGHHHAEPYGRVVAIERKRQTVESLLTFRPLDGREQATTSIRRDMKDDEEWAEVVRAGDEPIESDNIAWDGETMNFFGRTIPVLKVKKWLTDDELKALAVELAAEDEWPDVIGGAQ
ncbi:MAG: hypothetical protein ACR2HX_22315 [Pyrinomonadaceae bacterium]